MNTIELNQQGSITPTFTLGFFLLTGWEDFFVAQIGHTAKTIWQISAHKFGFNFVGEIEQQFFLPNAVPRHIFACQSKFGEIDTFCQFHQHFTRTFSYKIWCQTRNVSRKKDVRTKNAHLKRWWNWHLVNVKFLRVFISSKVVLF